MGAVMHGLADLTARAAPTAARRAHCAARSWYKRARCAGVRPLILEAVMSRWRSVGMVVVGICCAAGLASRAAAEEARAAAPPAAVTPPPSLGQQCQIDIKGDMKDQWMRAPQGASSLTQHHLAAGARSLDYSATAGTLIVRDDDDKPIASIGYVAYVRHDAKSAAARPLMFAFNGGPGSSSLWLHMGVLGPRRVLVSDPGPTPPGPYRTVDNEFSVLDKSDLVMIDPVGTGVSHAVCNHHDEEFWGVDADIDSISRFIAQYLSDNNRWTSPKYLLGESYGTTRGAGIVNYLRARRSLAFNGLILVSVATDIEAIFAQLPGNDRPYAVYLPGYAAVAWYHHMLPQQSAALEPFLTEVRAFAAGPYAAALLKGDALGDAERDAVVQKMHEYTGLSVDYLKAANLRVSEVEFAHELLKAQRKTLGRLDGRFTGPTQDLRAKETDYDPQSSAISAAYAATFLDYYHGELKFGQGESYRTTNFGIAAKWKWTHNTPQGEQPMVNTGVDLAEAIVKDANLKVLVLNGYYDLATPFSGTEYVMAHLGLPPGLGTRIEMKYYEAGHMMYVHPPSIAKMKRDLDEFIDATARP
jgi:carboxypeptidase C (cathepsin A)